MTNKTSNISSPKIYQLALEESSNPAENCVYIDDKPNLLEEAKKPWDGNNSIC